MLFLFYNINGEPMDKTEDNLSLEFFNWDYLSDEVLINFELDIEEKEN